jgi:hypothetical protein
MMWGERKENGIWIAKRRQFRYLLASGDRLIYLALGRFRLRIMKPEKPHDI